MANSDYGGNGYGMRNGHSKASSRAPAATPTRAQDTAAAPARRDASGKGAAAPATPKKRPSEAPKAARSARGVRVERRFTASGTDPLDAVVYERRSSAITNPDGSIVFKMEGAEVPAGWSQLATDIVISKYFRKAGLHGDKDVGETSVRQVVHRLAHTIRVAAEGDARRCRRAYFATQGRRRDVRGGALVPAREPVRRVQLAGLVQPRPLARVRNRGLGRQLGVGRRAPDGVTETTNGLRAPAVLGVLHPVGQRRPDVDLRAREVRGAPLQVRLGHRLELQRDPRPAGEALGRRHVVAA